MGHLREFVVSQGGGTMWQTLGSRGGTLPLPFRIIEVIHVALIGKTASRQRGILSIVAS